MGVGIAAATSNDGHGAHETTAPNLSDVSDSSALCTTCGASNTDFSAELDEVGGGQGLVDQRAWGVQASACAPSARPVVSAHLGAVPPLPPRREAELFGLHVLRPTTNRAIQKKRHRTPRRGPES